MNRVKLFVENFLVYGLGGMISKIIPLIMLPIITRLMTNTFYYGLSDISNIVVSFGSAIVIMGMYDAMFRMFFEKEDEKFKQEICSSAFYTVLLAGIVLLILGLIFRNTLSNFFFSSYEYTNLICIALITIVVGTTNTIISAPTRMQNKRKVFLVTNTITPIVSYSIAVFMLINKLYIMALPVAALISSVSMLLTFGVLNKKWFSIKLINLEYIKKMLLIGLPLVPNILIYWIFNSFDRLMISNILGTDQVGVYAVGAKIAQVSQLIYTAFAGGWQYFAYSTMKDGDQVKMISKIFEYLAVISVVCSLLVASFSKVILNLFFTGDYVNAFRVLPMLFLSPLLLMLFQIATSQCLIIKKTWPNSIFLIIGAILNVTINLNFISILGIEGAALGTLVGYVVSVILSVIYLKRKKLINISNRLKRNMIIMAIYAVVFRLAFEDKILLGIICTFIVCIYFFIQYKQEINTIKNKIFKKGDVI